jgi:hypothetical protein
MVPAGVALAADADPPAIPGATLTAPNSFLPLLKGAAGVAAKVFDGGPSFFSILAARCAAAVWAAADGVALALALGAVAGGDTLGGSVPASAGRPK